MTDGTIDVILNGRPESLPAGTTIASLLEARGLPIALVAVEHNGTILRRDDFQSAIVRTGDRLEIVHFVGGGSPGALDA